MRINYIISHQALAYSLYPSFFFAPQNIVTHNCSYAPPQQDTEHKSYTKTVDDPNFSPFPVSNAHALRATHQGKKGRGGRKVEERRINYKVPLQAPVRSLYPSFFFALQNTVTHDESYAPTFQNTDHQPHQKAVNDSLRSSLEVSDTHALPRPHKDSHDQPHAATHQRAHDESDTGSLQDAEHQPNAEAVGLPHPRPHKDSHD